MNLVQDLIKQKMNVDTSNTSDDNQKVHLEGDVLKPKV